MKDFFRAYYTPNNATLCLAGDFDPAQAKRWIEKYFGPIPAGPPVERVAAWTPELRDEKRIIAEDRVQLRRITWSWHTPGRYLEGDADLPKARWRQSPRSRSPVSIVPVGASQMRCVRCRTESGRPDVANSAADPPRIPTC